MRELLPAKLWLGHAGDVRNLRQLHDAGVTAIVDLAAEEPMPMLSRELVYCRFPLVDGVGNDPVLLSAAIQTTVALIRGGVEPVPLDSGRLAGSGAEGIAGCGAAGAVGGATA